MLKNLRIPLLAVLLSGVALTATTASAGASPRYQSGTYVVSGFRSHSFTLVFRGGRSARVSVRGSGVSDLDLYVYDQNGNLIGRDLSFSDRCVVRWTPRWTGRFRIVVKNRGYRSNLYRISTN